LAPVTSNDGVTLNPYLSNKIFNFVQTKTNKAMAKMIKEYGGKEKYSSKAAMMKHEKVEGKKVEKMEKKGVFPKMKKK
jgi:hypothetical protein